MESPKDQIVRLLEEGLDDGDVVEALRIALKKAKVSSGTESIEKEPSSKYGTEDLKIKSLKYYFNEIGLLSCDMAGALATYNKLGPFDYGLEAEEMVDIEKWKGEKGIVQFNGEIYSEEAIYFGQLKDGEPNNFGIMVNAIGST